ncbi:hypothetical protein Hanom_Chr02g00116751 [Helianthus anomalus]
MLIAIVNGDGWENRWVKSDWKKDENMAGRWRWVEVEDEVWWWGFSLKMKKMPG